MQRWVVREEKRRDECDEYAEAAYIIRSIAMLSYQKFLKDWTGRRSPKGC